MFNKELPTYLLTCTITDKHLPRFCPKTRYIYAPNSALTTTGFIVTFLPPLPLKVSFWCSIQLFWDKLYRLRKLPNEQASVAPENQLLQIIVIHVVLFYGSGTNCVLGCVISQSKHTHRRESSSNQNKQNTGNWSGPADDCPENSDSHARTGTPGTLCQRNSVTHLCP